MFHSALLLCFVHLVLVPTNGIDLSAHQTRKVPVQHRGKRITDSEETTIEQYPCLVSATRRESDDDTHFSILTGVLITPNWFLTNYLYIAIMEDNQGKGWKITGGITEALPSKYRNMSKYSSAKISRPDELALMRFYPPLETSATIQPAKLPPDPHFSSKCEDVMVVGWGTGRRRGDGGFEMRDMLSQTEAKVIKCEGKVRKYDSDTIPLNIFCLRLSNLVFTVLDQGLPVFCKNDTLIGILQYPYGDDDDSKTAYATNMSQYMTWLRKNTDVKVAYESEPIYHPTTTTTTTEYIPTQQEIKRSLSTTENDTMNSSGNNLKAALWCILIGLAVFLFGTN